MRRKSAQIREKAVVALQMKTAKQTRKAKRREEQLLAWSNLPDWITKRSNGQ